MKNAFILIHFGDKIKYLELELYFIFNLKKFTKNDIIYFYSINDTPKKFIDTVYELTKIKCIGYDDKNITYNIKNFKSYYEHFNTLRTCNFIFAYNLIEYDKVCVIESDMIIVENIDSIFDLNSPSILYYGDNELHHHQNCKIENLKKKNILEICHKGAKANGGVILFKPSIEKFQLYLKYLKIIIKNECKYPNETLFIYLNNLKIYNLPIKYNKSHVYTKKFNNKNALNTFSIYHFDMVPKHLELIKNNKIEELRPFKKKIINYYYKNIYKRYCETINNKLNNL